MFTFHVATDIYIFGIGGQIFEKELKAITVGTDGRHFFKMKEIKTLEDTFDEIISKLSLHLSF